MKPYGGISLRGSPFVPASSIQAVRVTMRADVDSQGQATANDMSLALCACDDCSKAGCGFASVPLGRFLEPFNCTVPTEWTSQYKPGNNGLGNSNRAVVSAGDSMPQGAIEVPMSDLAPLVMQGGKAVANTSWSLHRVHVGNENNSHNATFYVGDMWLVTRD